MHDFNEKTLTEEEQGSVDPSSDENGGEESDNYDYESTYVCSSEEDDTDDDAGERDDEWTMWDQLRDKAWTDIIEEDYKQSRTSLEEEGMPTEEAVQTAYKKVLPDFRKSILSTYTDQCLAWQQGVKDPIHKKIMGTKRKLEQDDDYEPEEAIRYAIRKRRYLIQDVTGTQSDDEMPWSENESSEEFDNV